MRVLLTSHQFLPKFSFGTEKLTFECGRELSKRGHEVQVMTSEPASEELPHGVQKDYVYVGLKVRAFGMSLGTTADPLRYEFDNPEMADRMRALIIKTAPDLLHVWHAGRLSGSIIAAAREMGVPVVFTATDFWSVCRVIHLRRADTGELCTGPNRAGTNCLRCYIARTHVSQEMKDHYLNKSDAELTAYVNLAKSPVLKNSRYGKRIRTVVERIPFLKDTINSADRVIAPTRLTRDMLLKNGVKPNLLRVSRYGIETSHISSVPQSPENPETVRFGFMGGLVRHKGVHNLVKAFRLNPRDMKAELKIYGDPERAPEYFSEIEDLAGDDPRIIFPGAFEGAKVGEVLPEIDVLVVPSAWYENTPLVVYEAFASGTPVVATDLGGLSEVIEHGKNGLLFAVDDVEDMSAQLTRFLEEPDLISRLREGIEPVRTVAESADDLEQVYREVIEARRSRKPERRGAGGPLRSSGRTPPAAER